MMEDSGIWEDPVVKRWLGTIAKKRTAYTYKSAFRAYLQYTRQTPSEMIDEAIEDSKQDPRHRKDVLLTKILGFYTYMKTDYPKKSRGTGEHRIIGKGVSDKLATTFSGAIRSFYATYDLTVRMKGRRKLPKPRVTNKRMIIGAEQVKALVDHARSPKARAIILTNFQGGLDASTLCSIKYGDVSEGLAKGEYPLKLELHRVKTGTDFYTFLGRDAIEALKAYITDMRSRGVEFSFDSPLFVQDKTKAAMAPENIQGMMAEVAVRAGFIDEKNNGHSFNPLGPHALRESFGSIMTNSGVPDTIVDFWHGHEIGEMAEAYRSVQFESLKKMYLERERLISISASPVNTEELTKKLRMELDQSNQTLQNNFQKLFTEHLELKSSFAKMDLENTDLKRRIQRTEEDLASLKKLIQEGLRQVG